MIGEQLSNRYRIDSELGQGGMGVIYRAHDLLLGRDVAVKLLSNAAFGAGSGKSAAGRLLREARSAAQLNHPNIVAVYDAGEQDGTTFIVMEFVEGDTLHDLLPKDLEEVLTIARQVCAALEHAHQHGVIHRDLKPENILWSGPVVKLTDFGLARVLTSRISLEGEVVGSVLYLAPEQAIGGEVDGRADLYALGVVLYEMVAGRLPFTADDPIAVISQHLHAPVVPPSTYNPAVPPALDALIVRMLAKRPEERPFSAQEVSRILEEIQERETKAGTSKPALLGSVLGEPEGRLRPLEQIARGRLVGRSQEFQLLRTHWASARQGQTQLVLLSGEPGVGKTRLASEFIAYVRLQGAVVLQGACYEYEAAIPYLPLSEALREWVSSQNDQALRERLGSLCVELARLAPEIDTRLGPLPPNPALSPEEERLRLFDHMARFLQSLSKENGLLLFIDDLHWADHGTFAMLQYLLRRLRGSHVLLLAAYREVELDRDHPLAAVLVDWNRERSVGVNRIRLGRLSLEECRALLAVLFGEAEISDEFAQAIYLETEGNPFFIEEVIKALIEGGQIYRQDGSWERRNIQELEIPQSIKEAIGRRLDRLSPESNETLQQAAVLGKVFEFQELTVYAGRPEEQLLDALDEALKAQLIKPGDGESFIFTHDKIREVLYEELNPIRRRRLHQRLAESLEQLYGSSALETHVQDLAHHFLESGDLQKGLQYTTLAAEKAAQLYAYEEAIRYYGYAAECAQSLNMPGRLAEIEEAAGDLLVPRGMFYPAVENYQRAIEHIQAYAESGGGAVDRERVKEIQAVLKNKIGTAYAQVGDARGPEFLQEAQEQLNPQTQLLELANNLTMLGRYLHYRGLHSQAITFFEQARELAEPPGLTLSLMYIYAFLAGAYQHLLRIDESMQWAWRCVELGSRNAFPFAEAIGYEFLAEDLFFLARWEEAIQYALKDQEIGERVGSLDRVAWAGFPQSACLFGQGRLVEARQVAAARLALAEEIVDHRLIAWYNGALGLILSDLGEGEEARESAQRSMEVSDQLQQVILQCWSRYALVYQLIKEKDWDGALEISRQAIDLYTPLENRVAPMYLGSIYPEALLGAGRTEEAEQFLSSFIARAGEVQAYFYEAIAWRVQGQVLAKLERSDEALSAFGEAVERLAAQDSRLELARALQRRGELLLRIGDEQAAQADQERARGLCSACGANEA
jgi:tetratricopeptide (TPR) repeat protein